uniref:Uncharacterized protein n=1 Tax=Tetranychus urticae TaxID=32264 RepID=T1JY19_TETUR
MSFKVFNSNKLQLKFTVYMDELFTVKNIRLKLKRMKHSPVQYYIFQEARLTIYCKLSQY